jgi:virginiamycin B lyase
VVFAWQVACAGLASAASFDVKEFPVPSGSGPHDVAPAPDGTVWYTGQRKGTLGRLNPADGTVREIPLGTNSAPHGVISGPDGNAWVTDGGQNAIVKVDAATHAVTVFPLPTSGYANLNTAVFDPHRILWFTGQSGIWGRLDPQEGKVQVWDAPKGMGPYGITATPSGGVYYASLAGSYLGQVDAPGKVTVVDPPTERQGARRAWSDSQGRVWVSYWSAGKVGRYDPQAKTWKEWPLPGSNPLPYAIYVDPEDKVWLSDFDANALVHFDPATETFDTIKLRSRNAAVRQLLGRPGEVWGAESGADRLVRIKTR